MDFDSVPGSDYMNIPSLNLPAAGYASALADEVRVSLRMSVFSLRGATFSPSRTRRPGISWLHQCWREIYGESTAAIKLHLK